MKTLQKGAIIAVVKIIFFRLFETETIQSMSLGDVKGHFSTKPIKIHRKGTIEREMFSCVPVEYAN